MKQRLLNALARWRISGLNRTLMVAAGVCVLLILLVGWRYRAAARLCTETLGSLHRQAGAPRKRENTKEPAAYDAIGAHGILGMVNKPPLKLWGVMGSAALIGGSPGDAKLYEVGASLPTGEKIVEIGCNEVVLEKDGNRRTEKVFAEMKQAHAPAAPRPPPSTADASHATGSTPPAGKAESVPKDAAGDKPPSEKIGAPGAP